MISARRDGREQVSLARAISKLGIASRTEAEQLIRQGRVMVNDRIVHSPAVWLDLRSDRISIDGKPARAQAPLYLAMHKPAGVVTTRNDERGRNTVFGLLPAGTPRVFPVGRLDKETSGLLLFTNDVRFGDLLTDPTRHIPKRYRVVLGGIPDPVHIALWQEGMTLEDGTQLLPAGVDQDREDGRRMVLTITEGRNRQIRRMMEESGYVVVSLMRFAIGSLSLGELPEGGVRTLTAEECRRLLDPAGGVAGRKGKTA